jgi:polysaccharide biosynthesis/export protein
MRRAFFTVALVMFTLVTIGCSTHTEPATSETPSAQQTTYTYRIGPEDVLAISVWQNDDISRTVPVRPDGMISLPLLNDVKAGGLTPEQLRDVLTERLAEYIPNVEVSVIVTQVKSFKISVLGGVVNPTRYTFQERTTVLEALAQAGGLQEFAARNRIVVIRKQGNTTQRLPFNYDKAVTENGEAENFNLQPGDVIVVPLRNF